MKKIYSLCLIAIMALFSVGCEEETVDAIYSITSEVGSSSFIGSSDLEKVNDEILAKIVAFEKQYTKEWKVTIKDGEYSDADKDAVSQFSAVKSAFSSVEAECNELVKSAEGLSGSFTLKGSFSVKRISSENKQLDSFAYEFIK